jgi:hypothetical protein
VKVSALKARVLETCSAPQAAYWLADEGSFRG